MVPVAVAVEAVGVVAVVDRWRWLCMGRWVVWRWCHYQVRVHIIARIHAAKVVERSTRVLLHTESHTTA